MQIIDINEKEWTEQEGLSSTGKRVKAWYARNSDGKIFLYKIPKRYLETGFLTFEMWTEIIAYHVGTALGLDIPAISPAKDQDSYGVLIENFLEGQETLKEAKDLLNPILDFLNLIDFTPETSIQHNLNKIQKFLNNNCWTKFKKMLIYDCLIGNNDRHDENWGLCLNWEILTSPKLGGLRLSPFYDNASCLAKELTEEGIEQLLNNEQKFNKYIKNSRPPNLYWDENDPKKYTHYELMEKLIEKEPETKQIIEEFLRIDYINPVKEIIKEIQALDVPCELRISDNRAKAIIKLLEARKEKLRELL